MVQIVERFQRQPAIDACEPTCFKNILDELASRSGAKALRQRPKALNAMFEYRRGGGCDSEVGIAKLDDVLKPRGFSVRKSFGAVSNLDKLRETCVDERKSYPIVGMAPEYFTEQAAGYKVEGRPRMDHALIVLKVASDNQTVTFFDPFENYLRKANVKIVVTELPSVRFNGYWGHADRGYWMAWVEPVSRQLESFDEDRSEGIP